MAQTDLGCPSMVHPAGAHIGYLYGNDEERNQVVPEYVRGGLSAGEVVAYFADAPEHGMREALEDLGVLPIDQAHRHQLIPQSAASTYYPRERFIPEAIIETLREYYERGRRDDLRGSRIAAEMSWVLRDIPGSERLIDYESRINDLIARNPMTVLCQYDMRRFDGATAFAVLGVHPLLILRHRVIVNPYIQHVAS